MYCNNSRAWYFRVNRDDFEYTVTIIYIMVTGCTCMSLYIIKRFRRRRRVKNREGERRRGGGVSGGRRLNYSKSPQGRIIPSPLEAGLF